MSDIEDYDDDYCDDEYNDDDDDDTFFDACCTDKHQPDNITSDIIELESYGIDAKFNVKPDKFTLKIKFNQNIIPNYLASVIQAIPDDYNTGEYIYTLIISIIFPFGYKISNNEIGIEITNFTHIHLQITNMIKNIISEQQYKKYKNNLAYIIYNDVFNFIPNVTQYCIGCSQTFDYQPPIPICCNRDLCLYQMINLGLTDLYNKLLHNPMESDLKISLCYSAIMSQRHEIIFGEIPSEIKSSCSSDQEAYCKIQNLINSIPSISTILQLTSSNTDLKKLLNEIDPHLYYFLTWIILSCQNYIQDATSDILNDLDPLFPKNLLVSSDKSQTQFTSKIKRVFKIISDSPQRATEFHKKELSSDHTIELVYHGTSVENLHNILHNSLEICSGTKKQITGAVHGNGIYLGKDLNTSLSYTRFGSIWDKSQIIENKTVGFCMIIKFAKPTDTSLYKDVGFYVVSKEDLVQISYLMLIGQN
jgi:hypothetical protein